MTAIQPSCDLDQFRITGLLADGGMAQLYRAVDRITGEKFAIKVPHFEYECDLQYYGRFEREERVGQRLSHPNIVRFLPVRERSRPYIVMEYLEGQTLRSIMRARGRLPEAEACSFAVQVARVLAYIHDEGVIHRDIKPENLFVTSTGELKLLDFGLALDLQGRRLTWGKHASNFGTTEYTAPEQLEGKRGDARTDIYALGSMIYEMITGKLPFEGSDEEIEAAKVKRDPVPPRTHGEVSVGLEAITMRAVARRPQDRYATAGDLIRDLESPQDAAALRIPPEGPAERAPTQGMSWVRWTVFLMSLLIFVLVCVSALRK